MKQKNIIGLNLRVAILVCVLGILLSASFSIASAHDESASTEASQDKNINETEAVLLLDQALSAAKDEDEKMMITKGFMLMRPDIKKKLSPVSLSSFTSTGVQVALQQSANPETCGTPYIIKLYEISNRLDPVSKQNLRYIISAVPAGLILNKKNETSHFIIYYNDTMGGDHQTSDAYAAKVSAYIEKAYDTEITSWNLPRPKSSLLDPITTKKYNIYLYRLGGGTLGVTFNLRNFPQRATEIAIDNSIIADDLLLATAAHEYFHAVQHSYISLGADDSFGADVRIWVSEGSTSWVEGEVRNRHPEVVGTDDWDTLKDRANYFMINPEWGFSLGQPWERNYKAFIFYYYLANNNNVDYKAGRQNYEVVKDVWTELDRRNWDQWEQAFDYAARNAPASYNNFEKSHKGFAKANLFKDTWYPRGNEFAKVSQVNVDLTTDKEVPGAYVAATNSISYFNISGPDILKYEVEFKSRNAATRFYSMFFTDGTEASEVEKSVTPSSKQIVERKAKFLIGRVGEAGNGDFDWKVKKLIGDHNSTDKNGQRTVKFYTGETIYTAGKNFTPNLPVNIYVTKDRAWNNEDDIATHKKDTAPMKSLTTDNDGIIANTELWKTRTIQDGGMDDKGTYDIIVDNDKNGKYNSSIDALFQSFDVNPGEIQILISGVADGAVYDHSVNANVKVTSKANLSKVKIVWGSEGTFDKSYPEADKITSEDQSHAFPQRSTDITHTITVTAEDHKGNKETKQLTFTIRKKKDNNDKPDDSYDVANSFLVGKDILDDFVRLATKKGDREGVLWYKDMMTKADAYASLPGDTPSDIRNATWDEYFNATYLVERNEEKIRNDFQNTPDVAILSNGFSDPMKAVLADNHIPSVLIGADLTNVNNYSVLIIPTGGLNGIDSPTIRAKLANYVNNSGVLIAFTQQRGYDFKALPGGEVNGVGWFEDQSCQYASVFISDYHQVLASQTSVTPSINVDGYFTRYPANTTVILGRTKNSMPAMIMYEFGSGLVIATTNYDDWAYGNYASSAEGRNLIRDTVSWARTAKKLPEYGSSEPVSIQVNITNNRGIAASNISFAAIDPSMGIAGYVNVSEPILPGETKTLFFNYTSTKAYGIWTIDSTLFNGGEAIQKNYDVAGFAVSRYKETPGGFTYLVSNISYGVSSDSENYANGGNGTFTITVWNRGKEDKDITVWWSFPHNYWTRPDSIYGAPGTTSPGHVSNLNRTLHVPGEGEASFQYTIPVYSYDRLWADFYDGDASSYSFLGKATRGFYSFDPSVDVRIAPKEDTYLSGDKVVLDLSLKNRLNAPTNVTADVIIIDADNNKIFENTLSAELSAYGYSNNTIEFTLPLDAKKGSYAVLAEASKDGDVIGYSSTSFRVLGAALKISKILPESISAGATSTFVFNITNSGKVDVAGGFLNVSLIDPGNSEIFNSSKTFDLLSNESTNMVFNIPFGDIVFGNYRLRHTLEFSGDRISGETIIPNTISAELSTDKPSYRIREPIDLTVNITNSGLFVQNMRVEIASIDLGFLKTEDVALNPKGTLAFSNSTLIPGDLNAGAHNISVNASIGASSVEEKLSFFIPQSQISVEFEDRDEYNIGDPFNFASHNTGGVDTNAMVNLSIKKDFTEVYRNSSIFPLKAGESATSSMVIPGNWVSGTYLAIVDAIDMSTGIKKTFYENLKVSGVNATVETKTERDVYFKTENVTIQTNLANQVYPIENATLNLKIISLSGSISPTPSPVPASAVSVEAAAIDSEQLLEQEKIKYNKMSVDEATIASASATSGVYSGKMKIGISDHGEMLASPGDWAGIQYPLGYEHVAVGTWLEGYFLAYQNSTIDHWAYADYGSRSGDYMSGSIRYRSINPVSYNVIENSPGNLIVGVSTRTSDNKLGIDQEFNMPKDRNHVTIAMTVTNTGSETLNNVVLKRNVDMDTDTGGIYGWAGFNNYFDFDPTYNMVYSYTNASQHPPAGRTTHTFGMMGSPEPDFYAPDNWNDYYQRNSPVDFASYPVRGDYMATLQWNLGSLAPGESRTVYVRYAVWGEGEGFEGLEDEKIVWETNIPVNLSANEVKEITTLTPVLNITGNFKLKATFLNEIGQKIGTSKNFFNIIDTNTTILLKTDKETYRPNETINITGTVYNFADTPIENALISVIAQNGGTTEVFNQTADIPAHGSYTFFATHKATGTFTLVGTVTVGAGGPLMAAEAGGIGNTFSGKITVAPPEVSASLSAPDMVGAEPFGVDLQISNKGPTEADLSIYANGESSSLNIPADRSTMLHYTANTRENFTYLIDITGDATLSLSKFIQYGIKTNIEIPDAFMEGTKSIPVTLTNIGPLDINTSMDFKLYKAKTYPADMVFSTSRPVFLPGGSENSTTIFLAYTLEQTDYILDYNSTVLQGTKAIHVAKLNDLSAELDTIDNGSGLIKAFINVSNLGLNDFIGSGRLNTSFYSEIKDLNISAGQNTSMEFNISTKFITPSSYNLTFQILADGNVILEKNTTITLHAPLFAVTEISKDPAYTIGNRGTMAFNVRNIGSAAGEAKLSLDIPGIYTATNSSILKPGDEQVISYSFLLPDDLEEKNYKVVYDLNDARNETSIYINGIKIDVNASLDKLMYREGEVAVLKLKVQNLRDMNLSLYSRTKFNDYDSQQEFNLAPLETNDSLMFNVPVNFTGDKVFDKIFYSVYTQTGRSIYINSIYVYRENNLSSGIQLHMDKQVYNSNDVATIYVNTTKPGLLNISARNLNINQTVSGEAVFTYRIPNETSGTYYLDYTFGNYSNLYPFDIIGYSGRIIEARLENATYESGSMVNLTLVTDINQDATGVLKLWIYSPDEGIVAEKEVPVILEKGENTLSESFEFATFITGVHKIAYELDIDIAGHSLVPMAFGSEYFDGIAPAESITPTPALTSTPVPTSTSKIEDTSGSGSSGSSSGSGGVISSEDPANIEGHETKDVQLRANQPVRVSFDALIHWVYEMEITGEENELTAIRIESLKGKPKNTIDIGTKYINILAGTKKIKEAIIRVRVENSWIASEGILNSNDVRMYRWNGSKWNELETKVIKKDETYTYLEAKTFGFSSFAISGLKAASTPATGETVTGITPAGTPEVTPEVLAPINLSVILGVIILISIIVVVYIKRKEIFKK